MGRPALFGEPATEAIRVRVTRAQRIALEEVAEENGQNIAATIRDAVDAYVADYRDRRVFRGPELETTA